MYHEFPADWGVLRPISRRPIRGHVLVTVGPQHRSGASNVARLHIPAPPRGKRRMGSRSTLTPTPNHVPADVQEYGRYKSEIRNLRHAWGEGNAAR